VIDRYAGTKAEAYADATRNLDLAEPRAWFLDALRARTGAGAHILDLGCGSGRDTRAFMDAGYRVDAVDASEDMARLASEYAGIPVRVVRAEDLDARAEYDGVWACASLLHVPWQDLPDVLNRLARALRPGGVAYISFQLGKRERVEEEAHYTDLTPARLDELLSHTPALELLELRISEDVRPDRAGVSWLSALLTVSPRSATR